MDGNTQGNTARTRKVIRISRKWLITAIVLIVVVLIAWYVGSKNMRYYGTAPTSNYLPSMSAPNIGISSESKANGMPRYYDGGSGQPTITDTREFLKTSFSATIKTRDVAEVVTDVKNIVKGADGRVDNLYSSEKSGSVTFVIAKSKFDAFKTEIEALTHRKLYTETISSQNLLSQKQGIEQQTTSVVTTLANLKSQKEALIASHTQTLQMINRELARIAANLATVRLDISLITSTTSQTVIDSLRSQEAVLVSQDAVQRQKLSSENSTYTAQSKYLDAQIANQDSNLTQVIKQDTQFTDNIETVNGTVYVSWISLWDMAGIFSPISPTIIVVILVILVLIFLSRKGYIPKIEVV